MTDPVEQSLREMRIRNKFFTGSGFLINFSDLQDVFSTIEDELEDIHDNLITLFHVISNSSLREELGIKESQQEDIERYNRAYQEIFESFNHVSENIAIFETYLQQEKTPFKMFSLKQKNEDTKDDIEHVDKRIKNYMYYSKKKLLPSLEESISLFYDVIEKYNRYVDIFNQRNAWVHENIPGCFNQKVPVILRLENLKNWSPKQKISRRRQ